MTPTVLVVRPNLSKNSQKYLTLLPKEACDYLKAYLERRVAEGEKLTPGSPIIAVSRGCEAVGDNSAKKTWFITTKNVSQEIREAMRPRFFTTRCDKKRSKHSQGMFLLGSPEFLVGCEDSRIENNQEIPLSLEEGHRLIPQDDDLYHIY